MSTRFRSETPEADAFGYSPMAEELSNALTANPAANEIAKRLLADWHDLAVKLEKERNECRKKSQATKSATAPSSAAGSSTP